ncbi:hypothetical protein ACIGNX_07365 [Actinosynnema sp. NPDC053489]|uniref:hypothetical protein n=1 Tax=Actinosynnema sp. NPDC053489 TaxID=3363916 RepID=UPI0037C57BD2
MTATGVRCTDRGLLDALAALVEALDPTPAAVVVRARAALVERSDAVELPLLSDSVHAGSVHTGVGRAGPAAPRRLAFDGLDVRLDPVAGGLGVAGFVRAGALVLARWPGGEVASAVDGTGRFRVGRVPFGPVRFVVRGAGRERATPWFVA